MHGSEFRGNLKSALKHKIVSLYDILLSDGSRRLAVAKNEAQRAEIKRKVTQKRVAALMEDGAFLDEKRSDDEVSH